VIDEPNDEIIEKLESLKIEEASENDLVFDKSKANSIPIAVIEIPDETKSISKEKVCAVKNLYCAYFYGI